MTGSEDGAVSALSFGGTEAPLGRRTDVELPVARLPTGTWMSLPLAVIAGSTPGPTVWISAAIHGDEINGVEICRRVLEAVDPSSMTGTLIAVPVVNVFGFVEGNRYLPDRRDLNRSFPGSRRGSLASQLAHLLLTEVVDRCELGIDLHTGSNHRSNLPQIRANLDDDRTRELAARFGAPFVLHAQTRDGSLRAAATKRGVRVLLYEAGEAERFDDDAIVVGARGVLSVLDEVGLTQGLGSSAGRVIEARRSRWLRSPRGGILRLGVDLGQTVERHQTIGIVSDALGVGESVMRSPVPGLVISAIRHPLVGRGDAVVHVAEDPQALR
ncbi:MAG: succinylglutamate desuccinylase/aspartoacylase family protein [Acidimicrobiia bacterium]|nr:succinylglutamate desuccinylase/aspartoacylase family protein [Acidimicrobiia bacterium]